MKIIVISSAPILTDQRLTSVARGRPWWANRRRTWSRATAIAALQSSWEWPSAGSASWALETWTPWGGVVLIPPHHLRVELLVELEIWGHHHHHHHHRVVIIIIITELSSSSSSSQSCHHHHHHHHRVVIIITELSSSSSLQSYHHHHHRVVIIITELSSSSSQSCHHYQYINHSCQWKYKCFPHGIMYYYMPSVMILT